MGPISESILLYERARRDGWWHRLGARLRGRPTRLLDLATIVAGGTISARHALGAQTVPIEQIRGTEGGAMRSTTPSTRCTHARTTAGMRLRGPGCRA